MSFGCLAILIGQKLIGAPGQCGCGEVVLALGGALGMPSYRAAGAAPAAKLPWGGKEGVV